MKTRQLLRADLPMRRRSGESLHIPVLYNDEKRYVCDIHFGDNGLCYLEDCNGIPTQIEKLQLILDARNTVDFKRAIDRKQAKQKELLAHIEKLQSEINILTLEMEETYRV